MTAPSLVRTSGDGPAWWLRRRRSRQRHGDVDVQFQAVALEAEPGSMIDGPPLVYLKLKSPRHKDRTDVIELIKAGLEIDECRAYLSAHAPSLAALFDEAVGRAAREDE